MRQRVATWKCADLIAALENAAIPCSRVNFLEEALLGEQARANGFVSTFDHPRVGPITMPTTPLNFSDSHYRSAETTPGLGEHSRAVLIELGLDPAEIDVLVQRGIIAVE
jgi:formyl-CoA transferase